MIVTGEPIADFVVNLALGVVGGITVGALILWVSGLLMAPRR